MKNRDILAAWKYHDGTKHSYWSIRNNPHYLDWANRPLPFKVFPKIEPLPLPRDVPQTGVAALSSISEPLPPSRTDSIPDLQDLARILYFSAGITKHRKSSGGEIYFRAAACTGALYEIELYVVTGDLPGLDAGVYHFNPADVSLRFLRKGDLGKDLSFRAARGILSLGERDGHLLLVTEIPCANDESINKWDGKEQQKLSPNIIICVTKSQNNPGQEEC